MSKGYTTKADVNAYLLKTASISDAEMDKVISGVEKMIDQITGRNFIADSVASEKLFDGDGSQEMLIDDCVEITKVEIGADDYGGSFTEIAATGANRYFKHPVNKDNKGNTLPYTKIILNSHVFPDGIQNNKITAKWGYSAAAPADIVFAATVFVAGVLNAQEPSGDQIKSESIGNYSVTYNSDKGNDSWSDFENAKSILDAYKKYSL